MLDCAPCDRRARHDPPLPAPPARLVRATRPRPALAPHPRPIPRARLRDHAAADAGRSRHAEVPGVPPSLSRRCEALAAAPVDDVRRSGTRSATTSAPCACTRSRARRSRATADGSPTTREALRAAARHRPLHGRRDPVVRLRPGRRGARHQRAPGPGPRLPRPAPDSRGSAGERRFWDLAEALVPAGRGYDFNQALMDFGATWCTPRRPRCAGLPHEALLRQPSTGSARRAADPCRSRRGRRRLIQDDDGRYLITRASRGSHLAGHVGVPGRQASSPANRSDALRRRSSPRSCRRPSRSATGSRPSAGNIPERTVVLHFYRCRLESGTIEPRE